MLTLGCLNFSFLRFEETQVYFLKKTQGFLKIQFKILEGIFVKIFSVIKSLLILFQHLFTLHSTNMHSMSTIWQSVFYAQRKLSSCSSHSRMGREAANSSNITNMVKKNDIVSEGDTNSEEIKEITSGDASNLKGINNKDHHWTGTGEPTGSDDSSLEVGGK